MNWFAINIREKAMPELNLKNTIQYKRMSCATYVLHSTMSAGRGVNFLSDKDKHGFLVAEKHS